MVGWTTALLLLLNHDATAGAANQSSAIGSAMGQALVAVQSVPIVTARPNAVPGAIRW